MERWGGEGERRGERLGEGEREEGEREGGERERREAGREGERGERETDESVDLLRV